MFRPGGDTTKHVEREIVIDYAPSNRLADIEAIEGRKSVGRSGDAQKGCPRKQSPQRDRQWNHSRVVVM